MKSSPNTAHNAGWPSQFRFAVSVFLVRRVLVPSFGG
jgi:hypothetical protein